MSASRARAHPRSRGENTVQELDFLRAIGSSPLTRGKLRPAVAARRNHGLIPAHAGKTLSGLAPDGAAWAHPRSRGENTYAGEDRNLALRSSPLTRGKRQRRPRRRPMSRLIPAHAGKTVGAAHECRYGGAHPRSRGENPSVGHDGRNLEGLIPAHAGKTGGGPRRGRGAWAHPRSRGENEKAGIPASLGSGSSPLTRGKRSGNGCNGRKRGLIPAHAGKTAPSMSSPWAGWAHPRSRGENEQA